MSPRERRLAALVTAQRDDIQREIYAAWAAQRSTDPREVVRGKLREAERYWLDIAERLEARGE